MKNKSDRNNRNNRNIKRRSNKKIKTSHIRNFGNVTKNKEIESVIEPNDSEIKNTTYKISKITGIKAIQKPGFVDKFIKFINERLFPPPTEEQINNLNFKTKIFYYLCNTNLGKYLIKKYSYLINKEELFTRLLANGYIKI